MKSARLCENVSPETYAFWAKYEDMIASMMDYAKKNNVSFSIRYDGGKDDPNYNQLWLIHVQKFVSADNENGRKHESICMYTSGVLDGRISEDVYIFYDEEGENE